VVSATPFVSLPASDRHLAQARKKPKSFLSIRLHTFGSGVLTNSLFFYRFRTLEAKTPGWHTLPSRSAVDSLAPAKSLCAACSEEPKYRNFFLCHTYGKHSRNPFICHTSEIKGFKSFTCHTFLELNTSFHFGRGLICGSESPLPTTHFAVHVFRFQGFFPCPVSITLGLRRV
jgi:hypothetical protein